MIEIGIGHFKETFEQYLSHDDLLKQNEHLVQKPS